MAKLIPEHVARKARERYEDLQEMDKVLDPDDRLSPAALDTKVAQEFGISVSAFRDLVMGITHTDAGGPIDVARRTRRDLFQRERQTLGETEARRRLQLRARNIDPTPKQEVLIQRVTVLDSKGRKVDQMDLEPGQSITVALVGVGGQG